MNTLPENDTLGDLLEQAAMLVTDDDCDTKRYIRLVEKFAELRGTNALQGFATGNRKGKPKKREQEILTPACITDFVRLVFGGEIALDPCAAIRVESTVNATKIYTGLEGDFNGLVEPWTDRTYCNPPFDKLKDWLAKAALEASLAGYGPVPEPKRISVLAPVRPHRKWYRAACIEAKRTGFVLELNPIAFIGFDQVFPAPLALLGFNVAKLAEGRELGDYA